MFRNYYQHRTDKTARVRAVNDQPSMTVQAEYAETVIDNILRKYRQTGMVKAPRGVPMYGDFSSVPDYMDARNKIAKMDEYFAALPAAVRDRFKNDPAELLAFLGDKRNLAEAVKLGLCRDPSKTPSDAPASSAGNPPNPVTDGLGDASNAPKTQNQQ